MTVVPGWLIPDGYRQEYPSLTVWGTFLDGSARQEKIGWGETPSICG
jgi:hypothetical protein